MRRKLTLFCKAARDFAWRISNWESIGAYSSDNVLIKWFLWRLLVACYATWEQIFASAVKIGCDNKSTVVFQEAPSVHLFPDQFCRRILDISGQWPLKLSSFT